MENNLWMSFAKCIIDLVFIRNVDIVILDRGVSIVCGLYIKDRHLRCWLKLEKLLNSSMAKRATSSNYKSRFDVGWDIHDVCGTRMLQAMREPERMQRNGKGVE